MLGTITKTVYGGGVTSSETYVVLPSGVKEVYVDVDMSVTFSTEGYHGYVHILNIPSVTTRNYMVANSSWKLSGIRLMFNSSKTPSSSLTVCIWDIFDRDGTSCADYSACSAKVYYK